MLGLVGWLGRCALVEGGGRGVRPAAQWLSFASPKESHQRKGDPAVCDPFAALRGNLGCSVTGCTAELTARFALRSNNCGESVHEACVSFGTHATPRPARPRRIQKGTWRTSLRAIAALGPTSRAQAPRAAQAGPSAAMARVAVRLLDVWLPTPFWLRLRRGGCGVGMGVEAPMLRHLTRRGCPSGARSAQRVPRRTPQPPRRRFAPTLSVGVADSRVAFLLLTFLWRSKEK